MRLLVVTQYFWPENFRVNDLVAELVRRGHEITVLTAWPNYPDGKVFNEFRNNPKMFDEFEGAKVVRVPIQPRGQGNIRLILNYLTFALSASVLGPWKLRNCEFDAIFAYEPSPITVGIPAAVMRSIKKVPLSFWVLDLWPETLQALGVVRSKIILKLVGKLVSSIYRRCDLILAQSKSFIPQIAGYAGNNAWIEYFPSWAEPIFDTKTVLPAPEVPLKPDSFDIMFTGNVGDAQDFPAILSAAEMLKSHTNIRWLIVGEGRMSGWVSAEIKKRDLSSSVLMFGKYPVERMPSFVMHADALLVALKNKPIFAMTIPGKLQSYLASGVPILAMLNGEGAEVVSNAQAGLTCPAGDHHALADAVLKLYQMSSKERTSMGLNGTTVCSNEFDRKKLIGQLELWLRKLSGSRRRS